MSTVIECFKITDILF